MSTVQSGTYQFTPLACLASVIYHETIGEPLIGKIEAGYVALNRTETKIFPPSICAVAFQYRQFSGLTHVWFDLESYQVANGILHGKYEPIFYHATFYHRVDVHPLWADYMIFLGTIGHHKFYRMPIKDSDAKNSKIK